MAKTRPPISYTSRDFESIRNDLINYAKIYYPDTYKDFNEASFGSLMIDLVSYVGDILSFYVDYQANESFLETSIETKNVLKLARQMGYKVPGSPSSTGVAAFFVTVPATSNGGSPNPDLIPILKAGTLVSSDSGAQFILNEDVDFGRSDTLIKVANVDSDGTVISYAMKAYGEIVSGEVRETTFEVGSEQKFLKLTLPDDNVTEILSVVDTEGREYYEVDYLSQDTVFKGVRNLQSDFETTPYILKELQTPRRFVVIHDLDEETAIQFGSGTEQELIDKVFPDPTSAVLKMHGKDYFIGTSFDPNKISKTEKMGIAPANTILTVRYRVNTTDNVNAPVGSIDSVVSTNVEFRESVTTRASALASISNFEVDNENPIVGSVSLPSVDEIKMRAIDSYASQNRAVTRQDYISLCYRMPARFGAVKRVNIVQDKDSFKRNLNLYVISEDVDGNLIRATTSLKKNLKTWLNRFKMINDTVDILDATIANISITFEVVSEFDADKTTALNECLQELKELYKTKFRIGEPLYLGDIYKALNDVDDVVDTIKVVINRKTGTNYSSAQFDVSDNLKKNGRVLIVPEDMILEIRDLDNDITGIIK